jgi:hypothetical protein
MTTRRIYLALCLLLASGACEHPVGPTPFVPTKPSDFPTTPPSGPSGLVYSGSVAVVTTAVAGSDSCVQADPVGTTSTAFPALKVNGEDATLLYPDAVDGWSLEGRLSDGMLQVSSTPESVTLPCPSGQTSYQRTWSATGTFSMTTHQLEVTAKFRYERPDGSLASEEDQRWSGLLVQRVTSTP